jgi:hypothetical protein
VSEPNIEVFSEGRGQEPWEQDPYARRVIRGSNYAICGMLDTADLATLVVSAVNGRAYTPPPLLPGMPARRGLARKSVAPSTTAATSSSASWTRPRSPPGSSLP